MAERIPQSFASGKGEEGIQELNGGALLIPSFTDSEKTYKVHADSGYCSCPAAIYKMARCKHVALAEAIEKTRGLKIGRKLAEKRVTEMAHKVFAPVKRGESCVESYNLLLEVVGSRYATEALVHAAMRRHGRVLAVNEIYGKRRAA